MRPRAIWRHLKDGLLLDEARNQHGIDAILLCIPAHIGFIRKRKYGVPYAAGTSSILCASRFGKPAVRATLPRNMPRSSRLRRLKNYRGEAVPKYAARNSSSAKASKAMVRRASARAHLGRRCRGNRLANAVIRGAGGIFSTTRRGSLARGRWREPRRSGVAEIRSGKRSSAFKKNSWHVPGFPRAPRRVPANKAH